MNATAEQSTQEPVIRLAQSMTEEDWHHPRGQVLSMSLADEFLRETGFIATTDDVNRPYLGKTGLLEALTVHMGSPTSASILPPTRHTYRPLWNADTDCYIKMLDVQAALEAHVAPLRFAQVPLTGHAFQFGEPVFALSAWRDQKGADFAFTTMNGERIVVEIKQPLRTRVQEEYIHWITAWEHLVHIKDREAALQFQADPALDKEITQQGRALLRVIKAKASLLDIPIGGVSLRPDDNEPWEMEGEREESAVMIVNCEAPLDRVLTLWRMTNAERNLRETRNISLDFNWQD